MKSFELEAYAIAKLLPKKKKTEKGKKKRQLDFLHSWLTKLLTQDVTKSLCPDSKSYFLGFPGGLVVKNLPAMQVTRFYFWVGTIPWEGNDDPLQCSSQENSMNRGTWWATDNGRKELDTTEGWTLSLFFPKWSTLIITSEFLLHKAKSKRLIVTFSPKEDCD